MKPETRNYSITKIIDMVTSDIKNTHTTNLKDLVYNTYKSTVKILDNIKDIFKNFSTTRRSTQFNHRVCLLGIFDFEKI